LKAVLDYILDTLYPHIILLKHNRDVSPENPTLQDVGPDILLDCVTACIIRVMGDCKRTYCIL